MLEDITFVTNLDFNGPIVMNFNIILVLGLGHIHIYKISMMCHRELYFVAEYYTLPVWLINKENYFSFIKNATVCYNVHVYCVSDCIYFTCFLCME